jgi:hypothetical protein
LESQKVKRDIGAGVGAVEKERGSCGVWQAGDRLRGMYMLAAVRIRIGRQGVYSGDVNNYESCS